MRLQVNTNYRDLKNDLVWQSPDRNQFGKEYDVLHKPEVYVSCRFCENCGTEIFGTWIRLIYCNDIESINNEQDPKLREAYKNYINLRQPYEGKVKRICEDEYDSFNQMKKCPICGELLLNDDGHFYSKTYGGRGVRPFGSSCFGKFAGLKPRHLNDSSGTFHFDYVYTPIGKLNGFRDEGLDDIFLKMEKERKSRERESAISLAEQFVANLGETENTTDIVTMSVDKFEGSSDNLKSYILNLITMENNIYALTKRLPVLYEQRIENDRNVRKIKSASLVNHAVDYYKENENAEFEEKKLTKELDKKKQLLESLNKELTDLKFKKDEGYTVEYPEEPQMPVFKKIGFFNKASATAENERLQLEYENNLKKYDRAVERYEQEKVDFEKNIVQKIENVIVRIDSLQDERVAICESINELRERRNRPLEIDTTGFNSLSEPLPCPEIAIKDLLDKEISTVEDLLKRTFEERKRLYDMNIIFGKYRNVVALSTFYEYLMSGRCTSLDGANGAYNIYEAECRANLIISQLSQVIELLEEIKNTQYMICSALESINSNLNTLNHTMSLATDSIKEIEVNTSNTNEYLSHIANNSDVIAYNTAATAYYSKKTAELTNSLGYMIALS